MNTCQQCGSKFKCEIDNVKGCWCMDLPPLVEVGEATDCLCKNCLMQEIEKKKSKSQPLVLNEDYYIEDGRWVFTENFHKKRGHCCGSDCRHCPFEHVNVR